MRCKECGMEFKPDDIVCEFCGTPAPERRKKRTLKGRAATARQTRAVARRMGAVTAQEYARAQAESVVRSARDQQENAAYAERMAEVLRKRQRREDLVYGLLVSFLVLLALVSATLCYLLLTRGPDPDLWFEKKPTSAVGVLPTPAGTQQLPTPVNTADASTVQTEQPALPTAVPTAEPTATPTASPTPIPTPKPAYKDLTDAELEALLLEGIERDFSREELKDLSKYELYIIRNGMYAHAGLSFRKTDLKTFFENCDWYDPDTSDAEKVYKRFNSHQIQNVETIVEIEKSKGYR